MVRNEPDNVKNRLAILYAISLLGKSAPLHTIRSLFIDSLETNPIEFEEMLADISSTDLLRVIDKSREKELLITENGLVVLSFFQDKLDSSTRVKIEEAVSKEELLGADYEWEHWYEKRTQMFHAMLLEDNKKILSLQLNLEEEDYDALFPLELPKNKDVPNLFLGFLKNISHKE